LNLLSCKLLTDENIHPEVVQFLRLEDCDVEDVSSLGLTGRSDESILAEAYSSQRIVLTHDRDFGRLAVMQRKPIQGIVLLRPGHIDPQFTIRTLQAVQAQDFNLSPRFVLVARQQRSQVHCRIRRW
jgi:predicted nuclease of predicted toxin-antitoxin system